MNLYPLIDEMAKAEGDWEPPTAREVLRFLIRLAEAIHDDADDSGDGSGYQQTVQNDG